MRVAIERKTLDLHSKKKVLDRLNEIKDGAESLEAQLDYDHRVYAARELLALARIQGLIRGFLGRIYAEEVRVRRKATITLQSVFRGRIGRKRWMYEYWKKISVVKSKDALDELIKRSTKTREAVIRKVQIWQEVFTFFLSFYLSVFLVVSLTFLLACFRACYLAFNFLFIHCLHHFLSLLHRFIWLSFHPFRSHLRTVF